MNEKLLEVLTSECDRLIEIVDSADPKSDEWKSAYAKLQEMIQQMNAFNKVETEYYTKCEERRIQEEHNKVMEELERQKMAQHVEIETLRRDTDLALERLKQIDWKRVSFEMAKVLIPLLITIAVRTIERREMYDFEEHGRLTSTAGRQFRIMDLFWKK